MLYFTNYSNNNNTTTRFGAQMESNSQIVPSLALLISAISEMKPNSGTAAVPPGAHVGFETRAALLIDDTLPILSQGTRSSSSRRLINGLAFFVFWPSNLYLRESDKWEDFCYRSYNSFNNGPPPSTPLRDQLLEQPAKRRRRSRLSTVARHATQWSKALR